MIGDGGLDGLSDWLAAAVVFLPALPLILVARLANRQEAGRLHGGFVRHCASLGRCDARRSCCGRCVPCGEYVRLW